MPKADHPTLRLFIVPRYASFTPEYDMPSGNPKNAFEAHWAVCTPDSLVKVGGKDGGFSAVAYYFGKEIQAKTGLPVGLVQCPFGGMPVEAFISLDAFKAHVNDDPGFARDIADLEGSKARSEQIKTAYPTAKAAYEQVGTASQTYSSSVKQCSSTSSSDSQLLQCVSQATSTWGTAVRQYQTSLAGIAYPSSAQSDANAAVAAAGAAVTKIDALAAAPDVATYQSLSQSPSFSASLNTVDSSFRQLYNNLNAS